MGPSKQSPATHLAPHHGYCRPKALIGRAAWHAPRLRLLQILRAHVFICTLLAERVTHGPADWHAGCKVGLLDSRLIRLATRRGISHQTPRV